MTNIGAFYDVVREELSQFGMFSYSGDCDFTMNETRGASSRWISVVFTTGEMWNSELVESVASALGRQAQDYMVYLSHEVIECPLFHVLISKGCALGYCDDQVSLERLGFY